MFEVLTAASVKTVVFWDDAPCSLVNGHTYRPDGGSSKHLWNVGVLVLDYTAQHPRRRSFSILNAFVYFSPCEVTVLGVSGHVVFLRQLTGRCKVEIWIVTRCMHVCVMRGHVLRLAAGQQAQLLVLGWGCGCSCVTCLVCVDTALDLLAPIKMANFLTSWATVSCLRMTLVLSLLTVDTRVLVCAKYLRLELQHDANRLWYCCLLYVTHIGFRLSLH
jgi:hypothetical protein